MVIEDSLGQASQEILSTSAERPPIFTTTLLGNARTLKAVSMEAMYQRYHIAGVDNLSEQQRISAVYDETIGLCFDKKSPAVGESDPSVRKQISRPSYRVLEEGRETVWEVSYGRVRLVLEPTPIYIDTLSSDRLQVPSFKIKHAFLADLHNANRVIDLEEIKGADAAINYFTFCYVVPFYYNRKELGGKYTLLTMPSREHDDLHMWSPEYFSFLYIHENAHAARAEVDQVLPGDNTQYEIAKERGAHWVALQAARKLRSFINPKKYRGFAESVLHSYDELSDSADHFSYAASTGKRAILRKNS